MTAPKIGLALTSRRYAVTDAPAGVDSKGRTFTVTVLEIDSHPDGALSVTISGRVFDEIGPTGLTSSAHWLQGDRFARGIANGIPALATAPGWVRELVEATTNTPGVAA
ncbi:hypothetical protein [Nocardioides sp. NPDC006273]|uniref:hypothetical protein n=1 Tax=Nocardioides sp. NPDC006273 TaxID=3155598 RepID=UPI0033BEDF37